MKVVVFPYSPYFIENNRKRIDIVKQQFYSNIELPKENIYDFFDCFMEEAELFYDECHLNNVGAHRFSKMIAKEGI